MTERRSHPDETASLPTQEVMDRFHRETRMLNELQAISALSREQYRRMSNDLAQRTLDDLGIRAAPGEAIPSTTEPHPALPDANPSSSLPVDDPPCGCACHDGTGDTQFCACDEHEPSVLSLEDRLLVALAARGEQRIGQLIRNAVPYVAADFATSVFYLSDEALVRAVEEYVFHEDDGGLHGAERHEYRVVDTPR